jgi:hypothetical protein
MALATAAASCGACESVVGAESGIKAAMPRLAAGFSVDVPGDPPIVVTHLEFREPQVFAESGHFVLNALVDVTGKSGGTTVSYLGVEKIPFVRSRATWRPQPPILPALQTIALTLRARQRAMAKRDLALFRDQLVSSHYQEGPFDRDAVLARLAVQFQSLPSFSSPSTWAIRVDRGEAQVFEETTAAWPAGNSQPRRMRFTLALEGGVWRFTSGLD